ncbi:hypothetical protein D3P06_00780 [Paracoccus aestuarii]|uniref:Uncharacterized protein n=1 Tax=Paracoccus aestuarii TaxID=453842 RepID=A0A419A2D6_9RHOB|nr:hypothetical protein [Paracoccus aestuarii]RJL07307.1 hypothetical protein D3P06_00780 [Paracoccus aestuarii]WCR00070.1 hypothetical protein JHW48_05010 [Paracoccus aestuarii]
MTVPSETKTAPDRPVPQTVHLAIYEHRHGTDVRVFLDADQAFAWRTDIAKAWWSDAFEDDPPPDDEIGAEYFERMLERDEYFSTMPRDIETGDHSPADPAGLGPSADTESSA